MYQDDEQYDQDVKEYDLIGVIEHRGDFASKNYVSYIKNYKNGNWYEILGEECKFKTFKQD